MKKLIFVFAMTMFVAIGCKTETKKETQTENAKKGIQEASFSISGMTCEIGCAKTIASKLSKKEGVINAKVVFADSTATVKFDASKTNKKELMAFVNDIADGKTYKASDSKSCKTDEKKTCCADKKDAKSCKTDEKKTCCADKKDAKSCKTDEKKTKI